MQPLRSHERRTMYTIEDDTHRLLLNGQSVWYDQRPIRAREPVDSKSLLYIARGQSERPLEVASHGDVPESGTPYNVWLHCKANNGDGVLISLYSSEVELVGGQFVFKMSTRFVGGRTGKILHPSG